MSTINMGAPEIFFGDIINMQNKKNISTVLLDEIINLILDEKLEAGYVFPNEIDMCKILGVGRSTLRETYTALSAMGFITRTKAGTTVNTSREIIASIPLRYMFRKSDLNETMQYRFMLESETAYLAAKYADDTAIAELERILKLMKKNEGNDIKELSLLDYQFHYAVALSTNNSLLKNTLAAVVNELEYTSYSGYTTDKQTVAFSIEYHEKILEAIKERNPEKARKAMREHVNNIYSVLRQLMYDKL